jgi:hypothetical protein
MLDLLTTKHNGKMTLTEAFESATMQTQPRNDVCGGESLRSTIGQHSTDLFRPWARATPTPQRVLLAVSALGSGRKPNWVSLDADQAHQGNLRLPRRTSSSCLGIASGTCKKRIMNGSCIYGEEVR